MSARSPPQRELQARSRPELCLLDPAIPPFCPLTANLKTSRSTTHHGGRAEAGRHPRGRPRRGPTRRQVHGGVPGRGAVRRAQRCTARGCGHTPGRAQAGPRGWQAEQRRAALPLRAGPRHLREPLAVPARRARAAAGPSRRGQGERGGPGARGGGGAPTGAALRPRGRVGGRCGPGGRQGCATEPAEPARRRQEARGARRRRRAAAPPRAPRGTAGRPARPRGTAPT